MKTVMHTVITQPAQYNLGMSTECPLKVLTSGTYRGCSRDSQGTNTKIYGLRFIDKFVFEKQQSFYYICTPVFYKKTNTQTFCMGTSAKCLRVPVVERRTVQIMGHSRDIHGTSVKHVF